MRGGGGNVATLRPPPPPLPHQDGREDDHDQGSPDINHLRPYDWATEHLSDDDLLAFHVGSGLLDHVAALLHDAAHLPELARDLDAWHDTFHGPDDVSSVYDHPDADRAPLHGP